jgi:hypothetical protein
VEHALVAGRRARDALAVQRAYCALVAKAMRA